MPVVGEPGPWSGGGAEELVVGAPAGMAGFSPEARRLSSSTNGLCASLAFLNSGDRVLSRSARNSFTTYSSTARVRVGKFVAIFSGVEVAGNSCPSFPNSAPIIAAISLFRYAYSNTDMRRSSLEA